MIFSLWVLTLICDKLSKQTDTFLYTYTTDEDLNNNITVSYRHYFEQGSGGKYPETGSGGYGDDHVWQDWTSDDGDEIEFPFNFKSSITKNPKGEVIYYRSNDGIEYNYSYNEKGDVQQLLFDNYTADYDDNGNLISFKVGETELNSYQYNCSVDPSLVTAIFYANGDIVNNEYDDNGNLTSIYTPDFGTHYSITYDENGMVTSVTDHRNNKKTEYVDTVVEEISDSTITQTTETEESTENIDTEPLIKRTAKVYNISDETPILMYSYDVYGESKNITLDSVSIDFSTSIEEDVDENDKTINITTSSATLGDNVWKAENTENSNDLLKKSSIIFGETTAYSRSFSYDTSLRVSSEIAKIGSSNISRNYTYDDNNNIISITSGTKSVKYKYDNLNQLIRSDDLFANKTYTYTYDNRGNILSKSQYSYTTTEDLSSLTPEKVDNYSYSSNEEWKDKLLTFNGNLITYDDSGNPLTYNGYNYVWEMGRQLKSISNGIDTYSYTYNQYGIRTSKTINDETTNYVIDNKVIKAEYTDDYSIVYWFDDKDNIVGFFYTDKTLENPTTQAYIYTKNLQGDITGILDSTGTQVVSYTYDAWGNVLSITGTAANTIGTINPIRYRGYYLDNETGYYYLQSRYYNPELCRFINADDANFICSIGKTNVNTFVFCENNTLKFSDITGKWVHYVIASVAGGVLNVVFYWLDCRLSNVKIKTSKIILNFLNGAINGIIAATGAGTIVQILAGITTNIVSTFISAKAPTEQDLAIAIVTGVLSGILCGTISKANGKHINKLVKTFGKKISKKLFKTGFGKTLIKAFKYVFKSCKKIIKTFLIKYIIPNISINVASRVKKY